MGGNGGIDLSTIPLMTEAQESALGQLLPAVMGMMGGFELGTPYQPGAYSPTSFPELASTPRKNGDRDGRNGDKIRREQLVDPSKRITKEQLTSPEGGTVVGGDGKTVIRDGTVMPRSEDGGAITGGQISEPVLDLILNSLPPGGITGTAGPLQQGLPREGITAPGTISGPVTPPGGTMPGGKGGTPTTVPETQPISPTQQALTEPFVGPFREGMTGNYPRRRI